MSLLFNPAAKGFVATEIVSLISFAVKKIKNGEDVVPEVCVLLKSLMVHKIILIHRVDFQVDLV